MPKPKTPKTTKSTKAKTSKRPAKAKAPTASKTAKAAKSTKKATKTTKAAKTSTSKGKKAPKISQPIRILVVDNEPPPFKVHVRRPGYYRRRTIALLRGIGRRLVYLWRAYLVVYAIVFYRYARRLAKWLYRLAKPWLKKLLALIMRIPPPIRRKIVIAAAVIVVVHIGYQALFGPKTPATPSSKSNTSATATPTPKLSKGTPTYKTMLPAGKTIQSLGGWTRVSPPNRNPVYAYVDKLGGIQIDVSEQPLPANLKNDDNAVEQLAQGFNATDKISAGGSVAYIGTSSNGPQSVIFVKNNLLILMKSVSPASDALWAAYINSLQLH